MMKKYGFKSLVSVIFQTIQIIVKVRILRRYHYFNVHRSTHKGTHNCEDALVKDRKPSKYQTIWSIPKIWKWTFIFVMQKCHSPWILVSEFEQETKFYNLTNYARYEENYNILETEWCELLRPGIIFMEKVK